MIDLYFLIPAVIPQMFVVFVELIIPVEIPSNEANAEIETQTVAPEAKISKRST